MKAADPRKEARPWWAWFTAVLVLGMLLRLAMVSRFPTIPVSDCNALVQFGRHFHDDGLFDSGYVWLWDNFNAGLPLVLCALFYLFPHADPGAVARIATAVVCGIVPVVPLVVWRRVVPLWVAVAAGVALAVWPGQVLYSGVVVQDNWIILPSVVVAALAVAALMGGKPSGIAAGLAYAAAGAIRQEMLIALAPLLLVVAWGLRVTPRRSAAVVLAAVVPLLALAAQRDICTRRFSLTTRHTGLAFLGSYIPGSAEGWQVSTPYIASVRPDLVGNPEGIYDAAFSLAVKEALRRPLFQAERITAWTLSVLVDGESSLLYASVGSPDVLPPAARARGEALAYDARRPLKLELALIDALFIAALIVGVRRRNRAILWLATPVAIKYGLHAVTNVEGRFFLATTAIEILAITLAAYELRVPRMPRVRTAAAGGFVAGMVGGLLLIAYTPRLNAWVQARDVMPQLTYRFTLEPATSGAKLACVEDEGLLAAIDPPLTATIRTLDNDPVPGERAVANCELTGSGAPQPLVLQVLDPYATGGYPDKLVQRVELDGREVYSHDIARDAGSGWADIPLGEVGEGTRRKVMVEVRALHPDRGPAWGQAAQTTFRLARP